MSSGPVRGPSMPGTPVGIPGAAMPRTRGRSRRSQQRCRAERALPQHSRLRATYGNPRSPPSARSGAFARRGRGRGARLRIRPCAPRPPILRSSRIPGHERRPCALQHAPVRPRGQPRCKQSGERGTLHRYIASHRMPFPASPGFSSSRDPGVDPTSATNTPLATSPNRSSGPSETRCNPAMPATETRNVRQHGRSWRTPPAIVTSNCDAVRRGREERRDTLDHRRRAQESAAARFGRPPCARGSA